MGTVHNIPLHSCFLKELANFIHKKIYKKRHLAEIKIYLPNRRSCRELKRHFIEIFSEKTFFLPSVYSISDEISLDEKKITLLLANLLKKNEKNRNISINTIYELAESLTSFIKNMTFSNINSERFDGFIPVHLQEYWKHSFEILKECLSDQEIRKILDSSKRRIELFFKSAFDTETTLCMKNLPSEQRSVIIAAGICDTNYFTRTFLNKVTDASNGILILCGSENEASNNYDINKKLLDTIAPRLTINFLTPEAKDADDKCVQLAEFHSINEEAFFVAFSVRKAIYENNSVLIVSTDPNLSEKIKYELKRWNIHVDYSAGELFSKSRSGLLIFSIVEMISSNFSTLDVIKVLKMSENNKKSALDLELFFRKQQVVPSKFFEAFSLWQAINDDEKTLSHSEAADISNLTNKFRKFIIDSRENKKFSDWFYFCSELVSLIDLNCAEEFKEVAKTFINHSDLLHEMNFQEFEIFLKNHVISSKIRQSHGYTNNVIMLGAIEAQLLDADFVIVAGANNDNWSASDKNDIWMTESMLKILGLESIDMKNEFLRCIFERLVRKKNVLITRSMVVSGIQQIRYIYLDRIIKKISDATLLKNLMSSIQKNHKHHIETAFPLPNPELHSRPNKMSVTDMNLLKNNPYSFYAKKILGLQGLSRINELKNIRGNYIHKILDVFVKKTKDKTNIFELKNISEAVLRSRWLNPADFGLWFFRIPNIFDFIVNNMDNSITSFPEIRGKIKVKILPDYFLELNCVADRIDINSSGCISIIDYKTGITPSIRQVKNLQALQLPVEAFICKNDGFGLKTNVIESLCLWSLNGSNEGGKIIYITRNLEETNELIEKTHEELIKLINKYNILGAPYDFNYDYEYDLSYRHLARVKEYFDA